jgi:hypothetical protein
MNQHRLFFRTLAFVVITCADILGSQSSVQEQAKVVTAVAPIFPFDLTLVNDNSVSVQIEVRINPAGEVAAAKIISGARLDLKDDENKLLYAARHWRFSPVSETSPTRTAVIVFNFLVMPKETAEEDLTPTFKPPFEIDVKGRSHWPVRDSDFPLSPTPSPLPKKKGP